MQFAEGYTGQIASTSTLKRRERSPSPQANKRRVPSYYTPQIYAEAPAVLTRGWSFDANGSDTAASSERSSPGLDWLKRTQELHLETPPLGGQHPLAGGLAAAAGTDANGDIGMETDAMQAEPVAPIPPESEQLAAPMSADLPQPSDLHLYRPIPVAPHHAPPLHQHLAGSPQAEQQPLSRPPSASSNRPVSLSAPSQLGAASFGLAGPIDWSQQQPAVLASEDSAMMMDDSAFSAAGRKQGGGWKVTMGYRSDCIKCLQRVPGHYSHVVPS
ncbi:hypothetical protein JCM10908_004285 [Rhodotorula pacifica]|uniref:uncharacterized protein n=1 Tax=Rhodotorula pacifica TaxID=1495444 RepID=UPI00316E202D